MPWLKFIVFADATDQLNKQITRHNKKNPCETLVQPEHHELLVYLYSIKDVFPNKIIDLFFA